jgi:outer membrane cobalamin receptor
MRYACLLVALVLAAVAPRGAAAQIRLEGRVTDDQTNQPVAGARVDVYDFTWRKLGSRVTDEQGGFRYELRRVGTYRLRVNRVGYAVTTTPELRTGAHSYLNVEIRMKSDAVLLAPLAVVARSSAMASPVLDGFHARMRSGLGTFITREEVQRARPTYVSDLVLRVPGLYASSGGAGSARQIYSGRTAGTAPNCPAQIYIDGFLMNPASDRNGEVMGMTLDEAVMPNDIEGIEIYRGLASVPAEFLSTEARCAVIAVWTRRGGARR